MELPQLTKYQCRLVETHVDLARNVAAQFWRRVSSRVEWGEIESAAFHGLVAAAVRFDTTIVPGDDPNYDPFLAFGSFARIRITGAVQDWLRSIDHVPKRQRKLYKDFHSLDDSLTPDQKAEELQVDLTKINAVIAAVESPPLSVDRLESSYDGSYDPQDSATWSGKPSGLPRSADPAEAVLTSAVQHVLVNTLDGLSDFEKSVIVLKYYLGLTFPQIAEDLGLTVAQVKIIHQETVVVLHSAMFRTVTS